MTLRTLAVVPARGGSKGLPGKNLRPVAGKPLIVHTIEAARGCPAVTRLVVSTDDPAIARVAREAGAEVPWLRPAELATDAASGFGVMRHALEACEREEGRRYEAFVYLQPTSPLRTAADVESAIALLSERGAPAVVSVCELEHPLAWTVEVGSSGELSPHPAASGGDYGKGRQAHPPAHRLNGAVYVYRAEFVRAGRPGLVPGTLAHVMPIDRSVDIDTEFDLALVETILSRRA